MPIEIKQACVYLILFAIFFSIEKLSWNVRMCMKFFSCIQRSTNSTSVSSVYDFSRVCVCVSLLSLSSKKQCIFRCLWSIFWLAISHIDSPVIKEASFSMQFLQFSIKVCHINTVDTKENSQKCVILQKYKLSYISPFLFEIRKGKLSRLVLISKRREIPEAYKNKTAPSKLKNKRVLNFSIWK